MEGSVASPWSKSVSSQHARHWLALLPSPQHGLEAGASPSAWQRDLGLILILLALATGIRTWFIQNTEVAARDSIGFIRYALELERLSWSRVVQSSQQHPGYPAMMMLVSWPVRALVGATNPASMQLAAQLTTALAGVMLVIPMYYLGRQFFDASISFWGAALFQCLPVTARVLSDGLSEGTFLLFLVTALLMGVLAVSRGSWRHAALCGLFGGLAYLTRPEGALVIVATGLVLCGVQLVRGWRISWPRWMACVASLTIASLLAGSPYYLVTGRFTKKPTPERLLEPSAGIPASQAHSPGRPVMAVVLAIYAPEGLKDRRIWALKAIVSEVVRSYQYILAVPVVLGIWWFRSLARQKPGTWVIASLVGMHAAVLWRLGSVVGYISDRHTLLIVLCGSFTGAAAVVHISYWLARVLTPFRPGEDSAALLASPRGGWLALVCLAALGGAGLHDAMKPLHGNRAGHRSAGIWLAANANPSDLILDPFCWAHYYSGKVISEGLEQPSPPPGYSPTRFVVMENTGNDHHRLPTMQQASQLAQSGKAVYHWPESLPLQQSKVVVYAVRQ